jgi:TM2 domain-containing membrane protein YozV
MQADKVDLFIMTNSKNFEGYNIPLIREKLLSLEDDRWIMLQTLALKDPTTTLIISLFAGSIGVDRFFIGDVGLGVAKLLTCGGFGIWTIVDWFMIMKRTRDKNMEKIMTLFF